MHRITESVIAAVLSAIILAFGAVIWQAIENGGLIAALGGVSQRVLDDRVDQAVAAGLQGARVDFRDGEEASVNEVHEAEAAVVVYAILARLRLRPTRHAGLGTC